MTCSPFIRVRMRFRNTRLFEMCLTVCMYEFEVREQSRTSETDGVSEVSLEDETQH